MSIAIKRIKSKKLAIILLLVLITLIAAGLFLWQRRGDDATAVRNENYTGEIKYEPATEQEKKESEQRKNDIISDKAEAEKDAANRLPNGKKPVTPVITLAGFSGGSATVQAYVPGIFEEGGTCTATLTAGDAVVTKQTAAFPNATTTDCQHINIPRSEFPAAGTWNVKVTYSSANAEGTSTQQQTIQVK